MNANVRYCHRTCKCEFCPEDIKAGEPMLETVVWGNKGGSSQRWQFKKRYHPQCFIDKSVQELRKTPYMGRTGRAPINIPNDTKLKRNRIMQRRASVVQRIRAEMDKPADKRNYDNIVHLGEMLEKFKEEIISCGGVPEKW